VVKYQSDVSALGFINSDAKLGERKAEFLALHAKYNAVPAADVIERAVKGLHDKKYVVHVANNKAEALKHLQDLLASTHKADAPASFSHGGVQSLDDIGFTAWYQTPAAAAYTNYKALSNANWGKPEHAKFSALGATSDWYFTTPSALAETGELVYASATATRVSLWAKHVVFVVGANKIVPTEADGLKRLYEYQKPLVGARTRKMYGAPDTFLFETTILGGQNPFNPAHIHVVLVKEALGY